MGKTALIFCYNKPSKPEDFIVRRYKDSLNATIAYYKLVSHTFFAELVDEFTVARLEALQLKENIKAS